VTAMADAAQELTGSPEFEPPRPPQVFVRAFTVPSGLPWEQMRAAQLEARHGSPLPIGEVMHRVRRVGPWSLGRAGRFAAFYIRARDYEGPFETIVDVNGALTPIAFGAPVRKLRQAGDLLGAAGVSMAVAGLVVVAVSVGLKSRSAAEDHLTHAERLAARQSHAADRLQHQRDLTMALTVAPGASHPLSAALSDLAWASAAKAPDSRIFAIHWDRGLLAVETRGEGAPFVASDRLVQRSARPLRPGVWLWGVTPAGAVNSGFLK